MSKHDQVNPSRTRCGLQNQSCFRSPERAQNVAPTRQRIRHSRPVDHRLEETGARQIPRPLRECFAQTRPLRATTRRDRSTSISANRATESGERLAQKKITDQLTLDRQALIDPTDKHFSIAQQCALLDLARSSYYYQPVGNHRKIWL